MRPFQAWHTGDCKQTNKSGENDGHEIGGAEARTQDEFENHRVTSWLACPGGDVVGFVTSRNAPLQRATLRSPCCAECSRDERGSLRPLRFARTQRHAWQQKRELVDSLDLASTDEGEKRRHDHHSSREGVLPGWILPKEEHQVSIRTGAQGRQC